MKRSRKNGGKSSGSRGMVESDSTDGLQSEAKRPKTDDVSLMVTLSALAKSDYLTLSDDKLCCWGKQLIGYCIARATHAVDSGRYYWECEILKSANDEKCAETEHIENISSGEGHVRLGWATDSAALNAPVGSDSHGFGYRDSMGSKVHNGVRVDSYGEEFGIGDVIGCHIVLDKGDPSRSEIRFFKNGIDQGTAFKGTLIHGSYFPAVSLYRDACVKVNFGPLFIYPLVAIQKQSNRTDNQNQIAVSAADSRYFAGTLPISELQPMSMEQKNVHWEYVSLRRAHYLSKNSND